ncbi:MAG: TIGR02530 family flagellar biosynthesis protein [bacterium]|jgi:flagellar operon protein
MSDKVFLPPPVLGPLVSPGQGRSGLRQPRQEGSFASHLNAARQLQFSRHAEERLAQRGISMSGETWQRLADAVARVDAKGGRDSLVLLDKLALVVNIPNRTVITAVDGESMKEKVFTNIDSAVIA